MKKNRIKIDVDNRAKYIARDKFGDNKVDNDEAEDNEIIEKKNHQIISKSEKKIRSSNLFIFRARLIFTKFKQTFIKALILYYFYQKHYI